MMNRFKCKNTWLERRRQKVTPPLVLKWEETGLLGEIHDFTQRCWLAYVLHNQSSYNSQVTLTDTELLGTFKRVSIPVVRRACIYQPGKMCYSEPINSTFGKEHLVTWMSLPPSQVIGQHIISREAEYVLDVTEVIKNQIGFMVNNKRMTVFLGIGIRDPNELTIRYL